jgi:anti-sigma factor RsiW
MNCSEARKVTYLAEYPEAVDQDVLEAKRHIKECSECRKFIEGEKSFSSLLRKAVKKEPIHDESRKRILNKGKTKRMFIKLPYRMLAIAASILILTVAGYMYFTHTKSDSVLEKIVNDHIKFLPIRQAHVDTASPDEITAWFRGRVDFPVLPPKISAKLSGGRLCILGKKHFALLFYEYNSSPVSVFITDGNVPGDLKTKKEVMLKDKKAYVLHRSGYTIMLWEDRGLMYALVSEMDVEQIQKIF